MVSALSWLVWCYLRLFSAPILFPLFFSLHLRQKKNPKSYVRVPFPTSCTLVHVFLSFSPKTPAFAWTHLLPPPTFTCHRGPLPLKYACSPISMSCHTHIKAREGWMTRTEYDPDRWMEYARVLALSGDVVVIQLFFMLPPVSCQPSHMKTPRGYRVTFASHSFDRRHDCAKRYSAFSLQTPFQQLKLLFSFLSIFLHLTSRTSFARYFLFSFLT